MAGEQASTDINRLKEEVKLEQLTNCVPTEMGCREAVEAFGRRGKAGGRVRRSLQTI